MQQINAKVSIKSAPKSPLLFPALAIFYHLRDKNGLECDAVIHLRNGNYGLVEIKLGGDILIEEGVKNLLKLRDIIDTNKMKEPSFLMILTAMGDIAYRRDDGVLLVPIGCLGK